MFVTPGTTPVGHKLTRDAAEQVARNWSLLLLNGLVLVVAGVLIFSIDWTSAASPRSSARCSSSRASRRP